MSTRRTHTPVRHRKRTVTLAIALICLCAGIAVTVAAVGAARRSAALPVSSSPVVSVSPPPAGETVSPETPSPSPSVSPSPSAPAASTAPAAASPSPSPSAQAASPAPAASAAADAVSNDWFADAVFIGDSRTDGLRLYSGIKGSNFLCYKGVTVFDIGKKECMDTSGGGKETILDALSRGSYAKVYLMLGINELGYYDDDAFHDSYSDLVDQIRSIQPKAAVYIQTLIPLNEEKTKAKGDPDYFTNARVDKFNTIIETVAQEKGAVLVDVASAFRNKAGGLDADLTTDGIHLTKAGYREWFTYLKEHPEG